MGARRKGFTLIELMIVIAIIAIIAAIGIPSIIAAIRAANERNASGSLKSMGSVQVAFRMSDADGNGVNDYWNADVAGLYYIRPTGLPNIIKLIELSVALADGNTDPIDQATTYDPPSPAHISSPKAGYWFMAQRSYQDSDGSTIDYGLRNASRFSLIAFPSSYGSSGKLVFIMSEAGTMFKTDPTSAEAIHGIMAYIAPPPNLAMITPLPASTPGNAPAVGVADTNGVLMQFYNTYPSDPTGGGGGDTGPRWSKMD